MDVSPEFWTFYQHAVAMAASQSCGILEQHIRNVKGMAEKDYIIQLQKRDEVRRIAAEKDAAEKAASAMV
jgi:hypothetical protein